MNSKATHTHKLLSIHDAVVVVVGSFSLLGERGIGPPLVVCREKYCDDWVHYAED